MSRKKENELISLYRDNGFYVARFRGINDGIIYKHRFLWYSKKEVIAILRNKLNCIVRKEAIF